MTAPAVAALTEHASEIRRLGKQTVENVVEIGRRLTAVRYGLDEARPLLGHGEWLPWLDREFGWSPSTAENYINLFKLSAKFPTVGNLDLDLRSLYILAAPSVPPEARAEIIERAEAGESVTVADVKTAIAKRKPEPEPKPEPSAVVRTEPEPKPRHGINQAVLPLFKNEDRLDAFCDAVRTPAARRFISLDQQLELAQDIIKSRLSAQRIEPWISMWVRKAARAG
jgi:antitoxin (DNA-binding transcriptional repressor) of toxin-antitoxin stability system